MHKVTNITNTKRRVTADGMGGAGGTEKRPRGRMWQSGAKHTALQNLNIATAIKTKVRQVMDHPARIAQSADPTIKMNVVRNGTHVGTRSRLDRSRPAAALNWRGMVQMRRVGASPGSPPRLQMRKSIRRLCIEMFKVAMIRKSNSYGIRVYAKRASMQPERCKV